MFSFFFYILGDYNSSLHDVMYEISQYIKTDAHEFEKKMLNSTEEKRMKLKNILIVVKDIEKSKQFYHDLFGLNKVLDNADLIS